ncbi:hypothetical protein B0T25DRAFT_136567 [Lasiosphaeria hispida]|uniref:Ubiquitin-like protease family profile domain-containing protein n=1 Tax=Lasiosphaeria hispida TaxID=260671 RepID=A0AAJ0MFB1_9PEZI|nr:hypothetical protein B0T25DRAFT_136567 [Lasiosphaeria hispida]
MAPIVTQPTPRRTDDGNGDGDKGHGAGHDKGLDERLGEQLAQAVRDLRRDAAAQRVSNPNVDFSGRSQAQARTKATKAWQRVRDAFDQSSHALRFPPSVIQSPETASIRSNLHFALWVLQSVDDFTMDTLEWVCDHVADCRLAPDQASRIRSLAALYRLPVSVLLFALDDYHVGTGRELCNALKQYANVPALQRDMTNLLRPLLESYQIDHGNTRYGYGKLAPRTRLSDVLQQLASSQCSTHLASTPQTARGTSEATATPQSSTRYRQPANEDGQSDVAISISRTQQEEGSLKPPEHDTHRPDRHTIFASGNALGAEPMAECSTPAASPSTTGRQLREPTQLSSQLGALEKSMPSTPGLAQMPLTPRGHEPSCSLETGVDNKPAAALTPRSKDAPSCPLSVDTRALGTSPLHTPRLDSVKHPAPNLPTSHAPSALSYSDSASVHPVPSSAVVNPQSRKRLHDEVAPSPSHDEQPRVKRATQQNGVQSEVDKNPEDTSLTIQVLQRGLDSLAPGQWLNDTAVNTVIHNIVRESASIGALDSTFLDSIARTDRARTQWARQCGYPQRRIILLPVCRSFHWLLFAWDHAQNTLSVYNPSKSSVTPGLDQQVSDRLMWLANRGNAESARPIPVQMNCTQQQNSTDCGVYVIQFVQCLLSGMEFPRELSSRRCESARNGWGYMIQRKMKSLARPNGVSTRLHLRETPVEVAASTGAGSSSSSQPESNTEESHNTKELTIEDLKECLLDLRESRAAAAKLGGKRRMTNASKAVRVRQLEEMDSWTARVVVAQFHLQTIKARYNRMSRRADEAVKAAIHRAAKRQELVNSQLASLQSFLQHRGHLHAFDTTAGEPLGQPKSSTLDLALSGLEYQVAQLMELTGDRQPSVHLSHDGYQCCVRSVVLMLAKRKAEELKARTEAGLTGAQASIENSLPQTQN